MLAHIGAFGSELIQYSLPTAVFGQAAAATTTTTIAGAPPFTAPQLPAEAATAMPPPVGLAAPVEASGAAQVQNPPSTLPFDSHTTILFVLIALPPTPSPSCWHPDTCLHI